MPNDEFSQNDRDAILFLYEVKRCYALLCGLLQGHRVSTNELQTNLFALP